MMVADHTSAEGGSMGPGLAGAPGDARDEERRARLRRIREEQGPGLKTVLGGGELAAAGTVEAAESEGDRLNEFIRQITEKKKQRRHQLQIIQDFFDNPVEFGVAIDDIPNSSSLEEILARKQELQYRIDLLRSVLDAMEGEMKMLLQAEQGALAELSGDPQP